jgi:GNAT superfamily N-acetyltransferase
VNRKEPRIVTSTWQIRPAGSGDAEHILNVSDQAAAWLVEHGLSEQWGPEPPSAEPSFVARVSSWIRDGEVVVAIDSEGDVHGYAVTGSFPPPYMDPIVAGRAIEDAYYVYTVASRMRHESRGSGRSLILWAKEQARAAGATYLRLDCWADNALLRAYYGDLGFEACDAYVDEGWPGTVMQLRV